MKRVLPITLLSPQGVAVRLGCSHTTVRAVLARCPEIPRYVIDHGSGGLTLAVPRDALAAIRRAVGQPGRPRG